MNLIVLGMHRSGTSCLTRLLVEMGAYFGPESQHTSFSPENPKGFWERLDMRIICDYLLQSQGCDWWKVANFNYESTPSAIMREADRLFNTTLDDLNTQSSWILKEPRLCLLWPFLERSVKNPIYILAHRDPSSVARSLLKRNGFDPLFSMALWEYYMISALNAVQDKPFILVDYDRLIDFPVETTKTIYENLCAIEESDLLLPKEKDIHSVVVKKLRRSATTAGEKIPFTDTQKNLAKALTTNPEEIKTVFPNTVEISPEAIEILRSGERRSTTEGWGYNPPTVPVERPKVDINMVVYNDADVLNDVLNDIANQSYPSFTINIFDDGSTDGSFEIASSFAEKNPNCYFYPNRLNLGLVRNFNRALLAGNADFVMFKSGNDRIKNTFVEQLAEMLRANPSLGLAYARDYPQVEDNSNPEPFPEEFYFRTNHRDKLKAASTVMHKYTIASPLWGMFRREILEKCRPYPYVVGGDHVLVCEASLYGDIDYIDDKLLARQLPQRDTHSLCNIHNEDMPRGMAPENMNYDQSYRVGYLLLIYEHLEMIAKARIKEELKQPLSEMALKILCKRFNWAIKPQADNFSKEICAAISSLPPTNEALLRRFFISIGNITQKCLYVLPNHEGLRNLDQKVRERI